MIQKCIENTLVLSWNCGLALRFHWGNITRDDQKKNSFLLANVVSLQLEYLKALMLSDHKILLQ